MSIRPAINSESSSPAEYLWHAEELGATVTLERTNERGESLAYITLWVLVPEDYLALVSGSTHGFTARRTTNGELRWWVTIEFAPLVTDEQLGIDGLDLDYSCGSTIESALEDSREYAALIVASYRGGEVLPTGSAA